MPKQDDEKFMRQVFDLAKKGKGHTSPNPLVGAIIVQNNKIIGQGYHLFAGGPHAEVMAYTEALQKTKDLSCATLYVNLEPCCHKGKRTPPCTELISKYPVEKIVISNKDPNPKVSGKGIDYLKSIGINVVENFLEDEGSKVNEIFFLNQKLNRSFVHLKCASGIDGKIALSSGQSKWITGKESRSVVHDYRFFYDAVLIGGNTLKKDNPRLDIRDGNFSSINKKNIKIILANPYEIDFSKYELFKNPENVFILSTVADKNINHLIPCTVIYPKKTFNWNEALIELYKHGICSILVEGGARVISSLIESQLVDRFSLFQAPYIMGNGIGFSDHLELGELNNKISFKIDYYRKVGDDFLFEGRF